MYVLSVEDIDLMILLANNQKVLSEVGRHEKQMDKLIRMGIIRPGGGVLTLTALGHKTANALLGRCLGSTMDAPLEADATSDANAVAGDDAHLNADPVEEGAAEASADADASGAALETA